MRILSTCFVTMVAMFFFNPTAQAQIRQGHPAIGNCEEFNAITKHLEKPLSVNDIVFPESIVLGLKGHLLVFPSIEDIISLTLSTYSKEDSIKHRLYLELDGSTCRTTGTYTTEKKIDDMKYKSQYSQNGNEFFNAKFIGHTKEKIDQGTNIFNWLLQIVKE